MKKFLSFVLIVGLGIQFCFAQSAPQSTQDATTLLKVGAQVPNFEFEIAPNKKANIADYKGQLVLLNFFATWCPPCNEEYPYLQKDIFEKYKDNPHFKLFSFGREQGWDIVTPFAKKKKVSFPVLPDVGRKIFALFATQYIPRNVLIDETGKIIYQSIGFSKDEFDKMKNIIKDRLSKYK